MCTPPVSHSVYLFHWSTCSVVSEIPVLWGRADDFRNGELGQKISICFIKF